MAKILKIKNPQLPLQEETFLTTRYTTGTSLTVKNSEGWADNDVVVVGNPGDERTELGLVSGISGATTITIDSGLNFDHPVDTPLFRSEWNQISLERKATGGSYSEIAEGKKTIEWDEKDGFTKIYIAAGEDTDTYRWRFYNTLTGGYSIYSGELPGTGLTQFHAGYLIEVVRMFAKAPGLASITDFDILRSLNRGQRNIDALNDRWWFALVDDSDSSRITATAGDYSYNLTSNFRGMDAIKVLDVNSQKYNLTYIPLVEFDAFKVDTSTSTRDDSTKYWTLLPPDGDNTIGYFGVHPTPETATIYFYRRYWRFLPELSGFASQTLVPLPEALINYALFDIYKIRQDRENSLFFYELYKENITLMKRIQRRQIGQAELQRFRGQRGYSRLFGEFSYQSRDTLVENYW